MQLSDKLNAEKQFIVILLTVIEHDSRYMTLANNVKVAVIFYDQPIDIPTEYFL